jgi:hypothetical protein
MNDITMLAIGAAFAVSTWLLIVLSDRLMGGEK